MSLGQAILLTVAVLTLGVYARWRRVRWLRELAYDHVKGLIKGDEHEAHLALRRRYRHQRPNLPIGNHQATGVHTAGVVRLADPRRYIRLKLSPALWPRIRHVRQVTVRWTPLVAYPSEQWLGKVAEAVAHFLAVDIAGVERTRLSVPRKRVTFTRRHDHVVPDVLPFDPLTGEELPDAG